MQWGDEGKGKVVDVLTPGYEVVARFQGGPNAGHTLIFGGDKYVLHTIPSGIFRDGSTNVIGNGVVIDPVILAGEIAKLENPAHPPDARRSKRGRKRGVQDRVDAKRNRPDVHGQNGPQRTEGG